MESETEKYIEILSRFIEKITQGVENFAYKGNHVRTGIFLINFIGKREDCCMKDIVKFLNVIPSTATRRIDKLVKLGLVERNLSINDGRLIKLSLSELGKEIYYSFTQSKLIGFDLMVEEFEREEISIFFNVVDRMLKRREQLKNKFHLIEN